MNKKSTYIDQITSVVLALIVISGVAASSWYWSRLLSTQQDDNPLTSPTLSPTNSPTPSPTPIVLLHGKETYTVTQGDHDGPTISQVQLNPLDVKKGEPLEITVKASDSSPVVSMKMKLQSDSTSQTIALKKIDELGTKSTWQGTIVPGSTLWYTYILTITATSDRGSSSATVAPRS